jgi:hypothetical protein
MSQPTADVGDVVAVSDVASEDGQVSPLSRQDGAHVVGAAEQPGGRADRRGQGGEGRRSLCHHESEPFEVAAVWVTHRIGSDPSSTVRVDPDAGGMHLPNAAHKASDICGSLLPALVDPCYGAPAPGPNR